MLRTKVGMISNELCALRAVTARLKSNWHRDRTLRRLARRQLPGWSLDFKLTNLVASLSRESYEPFFVLKKNEDGCMITRASLRDLGNWLTLDK